MTTDKASALPPESKLMRMFLRLGNERLAWAVRRFHCPVPDDTLVLEVGSGGNPFPRSDVLLDAYPDTRERHWEPLAVDRPFVFGVIEKLPFKTGAFGFLIAAHVLEHSPHPAQVLEEFQRVARAGYIEVPDALLERINPYKDHRSEITVRNGRLLIRKKPAWIADASTVELYEDRVKPLLTRELCTRHPFAFHVRYYWQNKIDYQVINPNVDASWDAPDSDNSPVVGGGMRTLVRNRLAAALRAGRRTRARAARTSLMQLLMCPTCESERLTRASDNIVCTDCGMTYEVKSGLPCLYPGASAMSAPV